MAFDDLKHAQRARLEYLDRLFFWDGAATRTSLIKQFGISNAQAALDFRAYLADAKKMRSATTPHHANTSRRRTFAG
jgi:glucose-6-phosphate isomerase